MDLLEKRLDSADPQMDCGSRYLLLNLILRRCLRLSFMHLELQWLKIQWFIVVNLRLSLALQ
jgi:hypothetical protein